MKKIIGITGNIGTGKSTLAKKLATICPLHIIELDDLRRYALWESTEKHHIELRENLAYLFHMKIINTWIDRQLFTDILFSSSNNLQAYSTIATPILIQDTKNKIDSQDINTLVVWAWLLEEGYTELLNSFVILTSFKNKQFIHEIHDSDLLQRKLLEPSYQSKLSFSKFIEIIEFNNDELNMKSINYLVSRINESQLFFL